MARWAAPSRSRWPAVAITCLCIHGAVAKSSSTSSSVAVVSVQSPASLAKIYEGSFVGCAPVPKEKTALLRTFTPPDKFGCSATYPADLEKPWVALVRSTSDCGAREQARHAEAAGAVGLVVTMVPKPKPEPSAENAAGDDAVAVTDAEDPPKIFVVAINVVLGNKLDEWNADHSDDRARITFEEYAPGLLERTFPNVFMLVLATSLVVLGAFFATSDLRIGSPIAPRNHEEVVEVDTWFPVIFVVSGSLMLTLLFFFMKYLIYVIIGVFCFGSGMTACDILHVNLRYYSPGLKRRFCGLNVEVAHVLAAILAIALVTAWFVFRKDPIGWIFQDLLGAALLCEIQKTLRVPSIKIAAGLLTLLFFFDIFWVFVSPLLFEKSVMVEVATGGGTQEMVPMLMRIPDLSPFDHQGMLGFGDIAIPGLLVSFLRRFDLLSKKSCSKGYFLPAVCGYAAGLVATSVALYVMQKGQPALLYLVPGTLGTTLLLACRRGELRALWLGTPRRSTAAPLVSASGGDTMAAGVAAEGGIEVEHV